MPSNEVGLLLDQFFLSEDDFGFFSNLIFQLSGISITERKRDLLIKRLKSHLLKNNFNSFSEYRAFLEKGSAPDFQIQEFVNVLTTNKTGFFREPQHFQYLKEILIPAWIDQNKKIIRVWSAASSTGEEPYSTAMVLRRFLPPEIKLQLIASDIDSKVLKTAQNGVYPQDKLPNIPFEDQALYTIRGRKQAEGWFKIKEDVRSIISFQRHNLNDPSLIQDETFDLIFCRNVMMYFDVKTRQTLVKKLYASLKPGGVLFVGHSEKIATTNLFARLRTAVYQRR
jgi:chemotaxis protein methyltransferase CheR